MEPIVEELRVRRAALCGLSAVCFDGYACRVTVRMNYAEGINAPPLEQVEEALGLLVLLHGLSYDAWVATVVDIWPQISAPKLASTCKEPLMLEIRLKGDCGVDKLRCSLTQRQERGRSAEYLHVLQSCKANTSGVGTCQPLKVPMRLASLRSQEAIGLRTMKKIVALFSRGDSTSILTLSQVTPCTTLTSMGVEDILDVVRMEAYGVQVCIPALSTLNIQCDPTLKLPVTTAIRHLLCGLTQPSVDFPGALAMSLWRSQTQTSTPFYWIPALFSALQSNQSLVNFNVADNFADLREDKRLEWLVYAVFLRPKKLQRLTFNCSDIKMKDIKVIEDMLAADQPLHMLVGEATASTSTSEKTYDATASRFHLVDPRSMCQDGNATVYCSPQPLTVPAIDRDGATVEWIRVMLPGHGEAWVHRDDAIEINQSKPSLRAEWSLPADHLSLVCFNSRTKDATQALLRVVHRGLESLALSESGVRGLLRWEDWLTQLFMICTDLRDLHLRGGIIQDLGAFTDAFRSGTLRLNSLVIQDPVNCRGGHVKRFFEALADPAHPAASLLEALEIRFKVETLEDLNVIHAMSEMFRTNSRLMKFRIRVCVLQSLEIASCYFEPIQDSQRDDWVAIPIENQTKLALLSVLRGEPSAPPAMGNVPASVFATIFAFSGRLLKRDGKVRIKQLPSAHFAMFTKGANDMDSDDENLIKELTRKQL